MRYGLPYKGSKNQIAEFIIDNLPQAEIFIDLFCGGGAVTHCAMIKNKYKKYIMNDIDERVPILFKKAIMGEYSLNNHPEWISREEFYQRKDDIYISLIWSFSNNGKDYLYAKDIEQMKKDYHNAIFSNDINILKKYGWDLQCSTYKDVYMRYLDYRKQIKEQKNESECITRLIEIERLQSLENLKNLQGLQNLQIYGNDYREIKIPDNSLIYCDIPYKDTNCGKYDGFDHDSFYKWAEKQDNIYISEYTMPDDFIVINSIEKLILSGSNGNDKKAIEKIYTNKKTYDKLSKRQKESIMINNAEQMSFLRGIYEQ